jgi:hypothetical protein
MDIMSFHVDDRRHPYLVLAHRTTPAPRPCRSRGDVHFRRKKLDVIVATYDRLAERSGTLLSGVGGGIAVGGRICRGGAYDERFQGREGYDYIRGAHFGSVP